MNSKKTKYILFPKPHLNHLLFLFYFISSVVKQGILKDFKGKDNLSIPFFKLFVYDIGDFISIIPHILRKKKIKSKIENSNQNRAISKESIEFIYTNIKTEKFEYNKNRILLHLFLISIFDFIAQISTVIYYLVKQKQQLEVKQANLNSMLIFNVFFLFIFSRILLHTPLYRHHYLSFIIFFICLIVLIVLDFLEIKSENKDKIVISIIYLSIRIFGALLYSIEDVIAKIMFLYYYFSPYSLLLSKALIQLVYLIIFSIPFTFVKFKDEKGEEMLLFSMFGGIFENKIYILLYIIYLINSFFYNSINFLLIDEFSPNHSAIAKIFENFGIFLTNIITENINSAHNLVTRIFMYIFLILGSFIYNEFLVINICGLGSNTKLFLEYKEKRELSLIDIYGDEDDISDNKSESSYNKTEELKSEKGKENEN